jgi:hypothetical protein
MNVRIKFPINFTAGIFYRDELQMNNYMVTLSMITNSLDGTINNIALDRIKYFIYHEIESSIFINSSDVERCEKFIDAGLKITTIPDAPVDQLIGIMLYYKLSSITEDRILIEEIEISSSIGEGLVYIHGSNENVDGLDIPEWWKSCDLIHCDSELIEDDEIVTLANVTAWRDLELEWPDEEESETGNTVVFADFKVLDDTE